MRSSISQPIPHRSITTSVFLIALMILQLSSLQMLHGQVRDCVSVPNLASKDTFQLELDREEIVVRVDKTEDEMSIEAACLDLQKSGFYRIVTGVEYTGGKSNESFFLQVIHPDSTVAGLCDANAGDVKVVHVVQDIEKVDFDTTRDAGIFFFRKGRNRIILNHYALIADAYPDFINPNTDGFDGPESVHLFKMVLEYLQESNYDVQISQSVDLDSAAIREPFTFSLNVANRGPATAVDIMLQQTLPTFVELDETSFSLLPESIEIEDSTQIIHWHLDSLRASETQSITVAGVLTEQSAEVNFPLTFQSMSRITSVCDTNSANNLDSTQVVIYKPAMSTDVTLSHAVETDSLSVENGDTLYFVPAGGQIRYALRVANLSEVDAQDVKVQSILPDSVMAEGPFPRDTLRWHLGAVAALSDTIVRFDAILASVMPPGLNVLTSFAYVEAENERQAQSHNNGDTVAVYNFVDTTSVDTGFVDVAITQSVASDSFVVSGTDTSWFAKPGEQVSFRLQARNRGNRPARQVVITDSLSPFLRAPNGDFIIKKVWRIGQFSAGSDTTFTIDAIVTQTLPVGLHELVSVANIQAENETAGRASDNLAEAILFAFKPDTVATELTDVAITQTIKTDSFSVGVSDTVWFARPGETVLYRLHVSNVLAVQARDVVLIDVLPDSVQSGAAASGDTLSWNLGNLSPASDTTVSFAAHISALIEQPDFQLVNRAVVSAGNEDSSRLSNNVSERPETVFVIPLPDTTADPDPPDTTDTGPIYNEGCEFFTLDHNVFKPESNGALGIDFELQDSQNVQFDVYDMSGYRIRTLANTIFEAGPNRLVWDGSGANGTPAGSGVYVVVLRSANFTCWKKVILAR